MQDLIIRTTTTPSSPEIFGHAKWDFCQLYGVGHNEIGSSFLTNAEIAIAHGGTLFIS